MVSLHAEVVVGISLGILIGVAPAVGAVLVGAAVELLDSSVSRVAVVVPALAIATAAGVAGGLVRLTVAHVPRLLAALAVVGLSAAYGYSRGVELASSVPRDWSREVERGRPLSEASLEAVDASGQVTIHPSGEIGNLDGYPSLPESLRADLADAEFRLPADLPLDELETRIERRLTERFDLAAVAVSLDPRGRATIAAAPPISGIARHVPDGYSAVTIRSFVPSGLARGEPVLVRADSRTIEGIVLADVGPTSLHDGSLVRARGREAADPDDADGAPTGAAPSPNEPGADVVPSNQHVANAGLGRVTVAVPTGSADVLLGSNVATVAVQSRNPRADFRAFTALEEANQAVRFVVLDDDLVESVRSTSSGPRVLAVRSEADDEWQFDPDPADLAAGWEAVVAGDRGTLDELVDASVAATPAVIEA